MFSKLPRRNAELTPERGGKSGNGSKADGRRNGFQRLAGSKQQIPRTVEARFRSFFAKPFAVNALKKSAELASAQSKRIRQCLLRSRTANTVFQVGFDFAAAGGIRIEPVK